MRITDIRNTQAIATSTDLHLDFSSISIEKYSVQEIIAAFLAIPEYVISISIGGNDFSKFSDYELAVILSHIPMQVCIKDLPLDRTLFVARDYLYKVNKSLNDEVFVFTESLPPIYKQDKEACETLIKYLQSQANVLADLAMAVLLQDFSAGLHPEVRNHASAIELYLKVSNRLPYANMADNMLALMHLDWNAHMRNAAANEDKIKFLEYLTSACAIVKQNVAIAQKSASVSTISADASKFRTPSKLFPADSILHAYDAKKAQHSSQDLIADCIVFLQKNRFLPAGKDSIDIDINITFNHIGHTALTLAADTGDLGMCRNLTTVAGADVNAVSKFGNTPMHVALYSHRRLEPQHQKVIEFLLDIGARLDIPNREGMTATDVASLMHCEQLLNKTRRKLVLTGP